MTTETYSKQDKHMQKPKWHIVGRKREFIDEIIKLQREHKTIKEISLITKKHRNTISTYVQWLRKNQHYENLEILNRIDSRLEEELGAMTVKNLLSYRYQLVPRQIEGNLKEELTIKEDDSSARLNYRELSAEEREEVRRAARLLHKGATSPP